jgi:hypothetical protein
MTHAATLAKAASAIGNASVSSTYPSFSVGKNAIINGAFDIWQRGTSFAAIANSAFSADRWRHQDNSEVVHTESRSTDVPTVAQAGVLANYSLLIDCTTADSSIGAAQYAGTSHNVEGYNWRKFAQRDLTLSFWVKATKTGTYCVSFRNSGSDRSYVAEYTVGAAGTWEKKTINIPASPSAGTWDYTTGTGLQIWFTLAVGSDYQTTAGAWTTGNYLGTANHVNACDSTSNDFRLALVQLEVGDVATDFEIVDHALEFWRCMRYYQAGVCDSLSGITYTPNGDTRGCQIPLYVPMRSNPTATVGNITSVLSTGASGQTTNTDIGTPTVTATNATLIKITSVSGYAGLAGAGDCAAWGNNAACAWTADAEL